MGLSRIAANMDKMEYVRDYDLRFVSFLIEDPSRHELELGQEGDAVFLVTRALHGSWAGDHIEFLNDFDDEDVFVFVEDRFKQIPVPPVEFVSRGKLVDAILKEAEEREDEEAEERRLPNTETVWKILAATVEALGVTEEEATSLWLQYEDRCNVRLRDVWPYIGLSSEAIRKSLEGFTP